MKGLMRWFKRLFETREENPFRRLELSALPTVYVVTKVWHDTDIVGVFTTLDIAKTEARMDAGTASLTWLQVNDGRSWVETSLDPAERAAYFIEARTLL